MSPNSWLLWGHEFIVWILNWYSGSSWLSVNFYNNLRYQLLLSVLQLQCIAYQVTFLLQMGWPVPVMPGARPWATWCVTHHKVVPSGFKSLLLHFAWPLLEPFVVGNWGVYSSHMGFGAFDGILGGSLWRYCLVLTPDASISAQHLVTPSYLELILCELLWVSQLVWSWCQFSDERRGHPVSDGRQRAVQTIYSGNVLLLMCQSLPFPFHLSLNFRRVTWHWVIEE